MFFDEPPEIRAAFAFWQLFRQFGYTSEEIFVGVIERDLLLKIETSNYEFCIKLGHTPMLADQFAKLWDQFAAEIYRVEEQALQNAVREFITPEILFKILQMCEDQEIELPNPGWLNKERLIN